MAKYDANAPWVQHVTSICSNFYSTFLVPIAWWQGGERVAAAGFAEGVEPDRYALPHLLDRLGETDGPTVCFTGAGSSVFALASPRESDAQVVLGPVFPLGADARALDAFVGALGLAGQQAESARYSAGLVPAITHERLRALCELVALLLGLPGQALGDDGHWEWDRAAAVHGRAIANLGRLPSAELHHLMGAISALVRAGDVDGVNQLLDEEDEALRRGLLARSSTRAGALAGARSAFTAMVSEATEHGAIPGGVDVQQAYTLLDAYVWQCQDLGTVGEVLRLLRTALVDLAGLVGEDSLGRPVSAEVATCMHEIEVNLDSCPTVDELALLIGRSRSYTTRLFRKETGMSVVEFATRRRMHAAQHMLRYTDLPLSTISARLGFASQSYFCNVFRRETGTTPRRYRAAAVPWDAEEEI